MKPPPQFGQTLRRTRSTQSPQKVHSNEQIHASADSDFERVRDDAEFTELVGARSRG